MRVKVRSLTLGLAAVALSLFAAACGSSSSSSSSSTPSTTGGGGGATLNGAGSTLAAPVYQQWGSKLKDQGVTLNYAAVGSGAGVAQLTAGTVNFAASDPPLKPEEQAKLTKGTAVHIPTVLGAITASYNLPGVKAGLRLDGKTLAGIFLGKITTWNAPAIAKLNPGVTLPSTSITVVHRSDSSGTTAGFTAFLAASSPQWASQVGTNKDVKWPTGTGAKGNAGVAAAVKQTPGAIGYVEQAYALQNNFTYAAVKNKAGNYVSPTIASTSAAVTEVKVPADLKFKATGTKSPQGYPIVSQTFVIAYQDLCKGGMSQSQAGALVKFLDYGLGDGQSVAQQLSYAPLPSALLTKAKAAVAKLTCNGQPVSG
jgi:phosphate transport system substrate-binding protein